MKLLFCITSDDQEMNREKEKRRSITLVVFAPRRLSITSGGTGTSELLPRSRPQNKHSQPSASEGLVQDGCHHWKDIRSLVFYRSRSGRLHCLEMSHMNTVWIISLLLQFRSDCPHISAVFMKRILCGVCMFSLRVRVCLWVCFFSS